ncbi:MAG: Ig-like domain repeat protein [Terriglobales bacterium]|jgi:pro-kumamolisin-like protein/Big-like domain-containing protein
MPRLRSLRTVAHRIYAPVLLGLNLLTWSLWALPFSYGQTNDLVHAQVDVTQRVILSGHHPSWAVAANDAGAVPDDVVLGRLTLVLARTPQREAAFQRLLEDQQTIGSANYHHWLTPVEIGQQFGVSAHDVAAIKNWLESQGLHGVSAANAGNRIHFTGPASAVGSAFGAPLRYYRVSGEQRFSISSDPQIPKALAGIIKSVSGLYTLQAQPQYMKSNVQATFGSQGQFCNEGICQSFIFPLDFSNIYGFGSFPILTFGAGQTIAIAGRSRVYKPDVENFESLSELPKKDHVETIPPAGTDPGAAKSTGDCTAPSQICGDQGEATLDVTRATSVAPGATVNLVASASTASEDGVQIAVDYVIDTNPVPAKILSLSFGNCEATAGSAGVTMYDTLFRQAAAEGISVFVAAGDSGAAGCDQPFVTPPVSQSASPNYICSSSYGTCVGGTEFNDPPGSNYWNGDDGQATAYIPEGAWNEPDNNGEPIVASGGGGASKFIPTPAWQVGPGVPAARTGRYTPDVAFSASAHDGYFVCLASAGTKSTPSDCVIQNNGNFGFVVFSGTSATAPSMAGIAAILNQSQNEAQGNLNPELYLLGADFYHSPFNDVTGASSGVADCDLHVPSMCNNSIPNTTDPSTAGLEGFLVGTGYDEATGLGSISEGTLVASWNGSTPLTLSSIPNPADSGAQVTFTVTATGANGSVPTGTVTFYADGNSLGQSSLNANGVAVFSTTALAVGAHSITATYSGDAQNPAAKSLPLIETVLNTTTGTATSVTLSSGQNPAPLGPVMLTAQVSGNNPTNTVTFLDGTVPIGSQPLAGFSGQAVFNAFALQAGRHSITALYAGDANNLSSTSPVLLQVMTATTATLLGSSAPVALPGQSVTFTAIVQSSSINTPAGTVTFKDGTTILATQALSSGSTSFSTSTLAVGSHSIVASYSGDTFDSASTSKTVAQKLNAASFTFAASPSSQTISSGASASYKLTVTPSGTYASEISFSCAFSPASSATCSASPLTPDAKVSSTTLTISGAQPASSAALHAVPRLYAVFWIPLGVASLVLAGARKRKFSSSVFAAFFAAALMVSAITMFGCGGGSSSTPPPTAEAQTYTVTVTATAPASANGASQAVTAKQTITLTVE